MYILKLTYISLTILFFALHYTIDSLLLTAAVRLVIYKTTKSIEKSWQWRSESENETSYMYLYTGWHKKMGTFEKPNRNWRNPRKKMYWQKLNHYNLPF